MYSADGASELNGIAFHAQKPVLAESLTASGTYSAGAIQQPVESATTGAFCIIDTCALSSIGGDYPGANAQFRFNARVPGSSGTAQTPGGWWLHWNFPYTHTVTVPPAGVGAGLMTLQGGGASQWAFTGVFQFGGTARNNCPWYFDLVNPGTGAVTMQPAFWWFTPSTPALQPVANDTSGQTARNGWAWQSVGGNGGTVSSIPSPTLNWGTVTSTALNGMGSCLTFLNNPPSVRVSGAQTQSIPNNANTVITWQLPINISLDNYSGWSTASSTWTAPFNGLYVASPLIAWGTASSAGNRLAGLQVAAGGTTYAYDGGAYAACTVAATGAPSACTASVRVLSLNAGDKVSAFGRQTSGSGLALNGTLGTRMLVTWMSQIAASGTTLTLTAPDPSFRFRAGALSGAALLAALNLHLGTDLQFLLNKPYFTGYQATAQTGFSNNSGFHAVTIDTVGALPRGGNGDNYGGWSSSNHWYASKLAGWYLVIFEGFATAPTAATATLTAALSIPASGGVTPVNTPDQYQQVFYPVGTGTASPGAVAIGLYYLAVGETVQPMLQAQDWGGTWGTVVQTGTDLINSTFSCFYMSQ